MKLSVRSVYLLLLVIHLLFLIWLLFFYHSDGFSRMDAAQTFRHNFIPFKGIGHMVYFAFAHSFQHGTLSYLMANLFGNIFLWIPLGYLANKLQLTVSSAKLVVATVIFCMLAECFQLITKRGNFDVDDIILNTLGVVLGYYLAKQVAYKV